MILGPVGTGKSSTAGILARAAVEADLVVRWEYVPTMLDAVEDRRSRREVFDRQRSADLLVWDDFGVGGLTEWQVGLIDRVVEHRYSRLKSMIVTTNVSLELLRTDPLLARFIDRWRQRTRPLEIGGRSMRTTG